MVVTFYSFKGGVGRSMAMANVAEILASFGYHVIASDWDLEAPGLERLFSDTLAQSDELASRPGLMDLLRAYKETLAGALTAPPDRRTHLQVGDVWLMRPSNYAIEVSTAQRGGSVRLLSAGARPAQNYRRYADDVREFDWKEFYEQWAGGAYIDFFRDELSAGPVTPSGERLQPAADIVLVDSRTGVTEHGGVCTHHLADLVVLMSAANDSNFYGSLRIAQSLAAPELQSSRSGRPVRVLPVRTRIDIASQVAEVNDFRRRFNETFAQFVPVGLQTRGTFFEDTEIPYIGLYSFGEANLSRGTTQREPNLFKAYHKLAEAIVECGVDAGLLRENTEAAARRDVHVITARAQPVAGTFEAIATKEGAAVATELVADLAQVGANVKVAAGGRGRKPEEGEARGIVGAILIVTRDAPPEWVRAQFDELLRRRALAPTFRVTPVVMPGVDVGAFPFLHRARVVHIDIEAGLPRVARLVRELSGPPPAIAFEPPTVCPYPGARPFEEAEARLFFGRDDEISQLKGRVNPRQPLVITGPKGAGKRSLVNAGLLPALHRGELVDGFVMGPLAVCNLGSKPFADMAAALATIDRDRDAASIQRALEQRPEALAEIVAAKTTGDQTFVLCVYSLENLFLPGADPSAATRLVQAVRTALAASSRFFVIATISTDVLEGHAPPFLSAVPHISVTISPLTRAQLATAISAPARLAGLAIEPAVVERITAEAQENAAPTALVQRLLRSMWHRRTGQALTDVSLQSIGSLPGAAIEAGNERMAAMTPPQQEAAKRLLATLALVEARNGKMTRAEAMKRCGEEAPVILARLSESPPILDVRAQTVAFAGSALRRHWIPLRTWSDHERERLHVRRWRIAYAMAAAVVLLFIAFAVLVNRANTIRESERIAIDSQQRLQDDPLEALGLAIAAATTAETDGAKRALAEALSARYPSAILRHAAPVGTAAFSRDGRLVATGDDAGIVNVWEVEGATVRQRLKHGARVTAVRFSPDGSHIASASYDGSVVSWTADGKEEWRMTSEPLERILTLEYRPDGSQLLAGGIDGQVWLIDASSGRVISTRDHGASITSAVFSENGRRIATTNYDGRVTLWNAASDASAVTHTPFPAPEGVPFPVVSGVFVNDAVVVAGAPGAALVDPGDVRRLLSVSDIWDVPALFGAQEPALAASADGSMVAFGGPGGAQLVALNGQLISVIYPTLPSGRPVGNIVDVEFHPTEPQILLADEDGHAILSDARAATQVGVFDGHRGRLRFAKFSPDGRTIITGSDDSSAALWSVAHEQVPRDSPFGFLLERATASVPKNVRLADIVPDRRQQEE